LLYTLYKTTQKGLQIWIKESKNKKMGTVPLLEKLERKRSLKQSRITHTVSRVIDKPPSPELLEIVKNEGTHFTKRRTIKLVSTFGVLFVCLFIIDSDLMEDETLN
jgi:hypothetical protein